MYVENKLRHKLYEQIQFSANAVILPVCAGAFEKRIWCNLFSQQECAVVFSEELNTSAHRVPL